MRHLMKMTMMSKVSLDMAAFVFDKDCILSLMNWLSPLYAFAFGSVCSLSI
jgi:hypothetical protein